MVRRTALITDIHGNLDGLRAVLDDIDRQDCDRVLCLGDLVDGGEESAGVVSLLRELAIPCVRGNHDEYCSERLPAETSAFLRALPETIVEEDTLYTHISPRHKCRKISDEIEAWNVFEETDWRLVFVGHVHIPYIFGRACPRPVSSTVYPIEYGKPLSLDPADRYIICVGPVGYSRDGFRQPRYAILDHQASTIEMRSVEGKLLPLG